MGRWPDPRSGTFSFAPNTGRLLSVLAKTAIKLLPAYGEWVLPLYHGQETSWPIPPQPRRRYPVHLEQRRQLSHDFTTWMYVHIRGLQERSTNVL